MREPDENVFEALQDVDWEENPDVTIHEWRLSLPLIRGGKQLQAEFLFKEEGFSSLILSTINDQNVRGKEVLLGSAELRKLRALLNASDLSPKKEEPQDGQTES